MATFSRIGSDIMQGHRVINCSDVKVWRCFYLIIIRFVKVSKYFIDNG